MAYNETLRLGPILGIFVGIGGILGIGFCIFRCCTLRSRCSQQRVKEHVENAANTSQPVGV